MAVRKIKHDVFKGRGCKSRANKVTRIRIICFNLHFCKMHLQSQVGISLCLKNICIVLSLV